MILSQNEYQLNLILIPISMFLWTRALTLEGQRSRTLECLPLTCVSLWCGTKDYGFQCDFLRNSWRIEQCFIACKFILKKRLEKIQVCYHKMNSLHERSFHKFSYFYRFHVGFMNICWHKLGEHTAKQYLGLTVNKDFSVLVPDSSSDHCTFCLQVDLFKSSWTTLDL